MHNSIFMNILNTSNDLLHEPYGLSLIETFSFDNIIEQLTALSIFHDEMNIGFGLDDLIELNDIGVS